MEKILSSIFLLALLLSTLIIFTRSPSTYVENRNAKCRESIRLNESPGPVTYERLATYEVKYTMH